MDEDDLNGGAPAGENAGDAANLPADSGQQQGAPDGQQPDPASGSAAATPSAMDAMLDKLTEGGHKPEPVPGQGNRARDASGRFVPTAAQQAAAAQAAAPAAGQPPANGAPPVPGQPPAAPDTRTQEERERDEVLSGVKSERGRERIKAVFAERQEAQQHLGAVRDMVTGAGLTAETFGQHIEFARLVNSNDLRDLQQAAQMIEAARANVYRRLGIDAPGVDALSDFPDLSNAVAQNQMARPAALEMAQLRRERQQIQQRQQVEQQTQQENQQFQQAVARAEQDMKNYMASRANEADAPVRAKVVTDFFAKQDNLRQFANTYQPHQWASAIRLMYDSAHVALPAQRGPAPISGRTGALGRPATTANATPEQKMFDTIDNLGL